MSATNISMDNVLKDLGDVYGKELAALPVSRDLPRLARKFTLLEYDVDLGAFVEETISPNKEKDDIAVVLFNVMTKMAKRLYSRVADHVIPDRETFNAEVNLQIHESLTAYLVKHYKERGRLVRVLKACNQSVVIATIQHIRQALMSRKILFKDCRGQWFLSFHTGETGDKPCVTQRRIEQVYNLTPDASSLINTYKFEWELGIEFDSLECNAITRIYLRMVSVDFSVVSESDMDAEARADAEAKLKQALANCSLECDFKLA